jgi:hypothetical protein
MKVNTDSYFQSEEVDVGHGVTSYMYDKEGVRMLVQKYFPNKSFEILPVSIMKMCGGGVRIMKKYIAHIKLDY